MLIMYIKLISVNTRDKITFIYTSVQLDFLGCNKSKHFTKFINYFCLEYFLTILFYYIFIILFYLFIIMIQRLYLRTMFHFLCLMIRDNLMNNYKKYNTILIVDAVIFLYFKLKYMLLYSS